MSYTEINDKNPMLKEWSLLFIRNVCSWSEKIREELHKPELANASAGLIQTLSESRLDVCFKKEMEKLKRLGKYSKTKLDSTNSSF